MPAIRTKVVGCSFHDDYPAYFHKLAQRRPDRYPKCELIRDPDNPHDANAVAVKVGQKRVGHLPADLAGRVAELMDAGIEVRASVVSVQVWAEMPANPSMEIELLREPTQEKEHINE